MKKSPIISGVKMLLSVQQQGRALTVTFLLVLQSLLDFLSFASFLPLLVVLMDTDPATSNTVVTSITRYTQGYDRSGVVVYFTLFILFFFIAKTILTIWITHVKARFAYDTANSIASQMVNRYMNLSYQSFSHVDYSKELNRIVNLPIFLANNIIIPLGTLFAEVFITFLLLAAVAIYNIQIFLFMLVPFLPLALLYRNQRRHMHSVSTQTKEAHPALTKFVMQIIEGLPDIRVFGREVYFKKRFNKAQQHLGNVFAKSHSLQTSTSRITELIAALCVCCLIWAAFFFTGTQETLLLLSLYAGASFRIIPSVNRMLTAIAQIKSNQYVVDELNAFHAHKTEPLEDDHVAELNQEIQLRNVSYDYGKNQILNNVTLTIKKGERVALLGTSGSGKTTILLIILRFLKEKSGVFLVDQNPVSAAQWLNQIGYVPQQPFILDGTILENIAFGISPDEIDVEKAKSLVALLGLKSWSETLPQKLHTRIGERGAQLSGGQRQRIALARALYQEKSIYLLDEATSNLDKETEQTIMNHFVKLSEQGKTVVMATHKDTLLNFFDAAYSLENGELMNMAQSSNV